MQRKSRSIAFVLFLTLSVLSWSGSWLFAQAPIPTPQELDQLLAPVALYPDSLLAQITTASTNPQEVLDVSNWLLQNPGLQGAALSDAAERQGFDPAFVALVNFPDVLNMMAEDIDDFAAIGEAFSADQGSVSASIQRLRAQAYAAGTLQTNQQQTVEVQQAGPQPIYVIQPANPQIVYVPIYNPTTIYYRSPTPVYVTYGPPIPISILLVSTRPWGWAGWGWNWSSHRAYYNHTIWVGWRAPYRPPNVWYRPRPIPYNARPGYGGNWNYRPPNYRPPQPRPLPANRPAWGPNNRPGTGRPPVQQPKPGRPGQPNTKPGATRPGGNPPGQTRPTQPNGNRPPVNKPAPQPKPTQPGTRPGQPSTRPAPQPKPTQPNTRPAPKPKPTQPTTRPAPQPKPTQPTTRPAPKPKPTQPATRPAPQPKPTQPATRPAPKPKPAQPNTKQAKPNTKPQQGQNPGSRPRPQSNN